MLRPTTILISLPLTLIILSFAISNRAPVDLELWPLPATVTLPGYVVVLVPLAIGLIVGVALTWMAAGRHRKLARQRGRKLEALLEEIKGYRAKAETEREETLRRQEEERIARQRAATSQIAAADSGEAPKAIAGPSGSKAA